MTARVLSEPYTRTDPLSLFLHLSPCFSSHVCDAMEPQTQVHIELCDDVSAHMFLIVPHSSCSIDRAAPEMSKHAADRSSAPVPENPSVSHKPLLLTHTAGSRSTLTVGNSDDERDSNPSFELFTRGSLAACQASPPRMKRLHREFLMSWRQEQGIPAEILSDKELEETARLMTSDREEQGQNVFLELWRNNTRQKDRMDRIDSHAQCQDRLNLITGRGLRQSRPVMDAGDLHAHSGLYAQC
ncbi:hypothetical protein E1301_Tti020897 [Triplophysa tibetana]|uniref:Uncharacterized protein n=1 Tax=Triplophysa tibetana TaxID=1572043 RepID=A0A5A9PDE9_9TELE|nr:hypothetical protein E1301_Tti020897 [Triplophysa tibetana]